MKSTDLNFIHPEDRNNVKYWTRRLGVSTTELYDAILQTGSLNTQNVKTYLRRDSWFYHPIEAARRISKRVLTFIF